MELNKLNLSAPNIASLNATQSNEVLKTEDNTQPEIGDNKPSEKQYSADEILTFLAARNADYKIIIDNQKKVDIQVVNVVNDTDLIAEPPESNISTVDDFDEDKAQPKKSFWGWLRNIISGRGKIKVVKYGDDGCPIGGLGDWYAGNTGTYGVGINF